MISERFFSYEKCNVHPIPCRQLVSIPPHRLCIRGSSNSSNLPLVAINTSNQLPYKLTHSNYPSWRATFLTILIGYDLMGYLDGTIKCPPTSAATFSSPAIACYAHWLRHDQLLLNTIFFFRFEDCHSSYCYVLYEPWCLETLCPLIFKQILGSYYAT